MPTENARGSYANAAALIHGVIQTTAACRTLFFGWKKKETCESHGHRAQAAKHMGAAAHSLHCSAAHVVHAHGKQEPGDDWGWLALRTPSQDSVCHGVGMVSPGFFWKTTTTLPPPADRIFVETVTVKPRVVHDPAMKRRDKECISTP